MSLDWARVAAETRYRVAGCVYRARRAGVRLDVVFEEVPRYRELYIVIGPRVIAVKLLSRRWPTPPSRLRRAIAIALREGKRRGRLVDVVLGLASRLTAGARRLAERSRARPVVAEQLPRTVEQLVERLVAAIAAALAYSTTSSASTQPTRMTRGV